MSEKPSRKDEGRINRPATAVICGVIGAVLYFAFVSLYALVSLKTGAGESAYMPVGILLGALAGFIGGFAAARRIKQKGAVYGALSGLVSALICSVALFVVNNSAAGNGIFILMAAMISGGAAGGITAVNLRIRKKY